MSVSEAQLKKISRYIGERIQLIRKAAEMTQVELEEKSGVYDVGAIERGETNPTLLTLLRLADALGVGINSLFEGIDDVGDNEAQNQISALLHNQPARVKLKALELVRALLS